jgi:fatty-acyl-CoA synthase
MAALVIDEAFGLDGLLAHLGERLPSTAVPLFLRLKDKLDVTETFKPKKIDLVCQGFDPNKIEDQLYFNDRPSKSFVRLDPELYQRILLGHIVL